MGHGCDGAFYDGAFYFSIVKWENTNVSKLIFHLSIDHKGLPYFFDHTGVNSLVIRSINHIIWPIKYGSNDMGHTIGLIGYFPIVWTLSESDMLIDRFVFRKVNAQTVHSRLE